MKKLGLVLAAAAALCATPALARPECLMIGQINDFHPLDNKTLIVTDNWKQKFRVSLLGDCSDLKFRNNIAIKTLVGNQLTCVTRGDDVMVRAFGGLPDRCPISQIDRYTPDMEKADMEAAAAAKAARDASR